MKSLYCYMTRMSQTFFFFVTRTVEQRPTDCEDNGDTKKKKDLFVCTLLYRPHSGNLSWTQLLCPCIIP